MSRRRGRSLAGPRFPGFPRREGLVPLALGLAALLFGIGAARSDRLDDAFKVGNDAYLRGDHGAAISAYEHLQQEQVVSPDLAFNLGDAYFRKGRLGPAIWAWERALALDPDHEDARYNLEQARRLADRRVQDKLEGAEREPGWIRLVTLLSPSTEAWAFVGLYLGFFACFGLWLRARRQSRLAEEAGEAAHVSPTATFGVLAGTLAVAALCAGTILLGRVQLERTPYGVVLPDAASVKEGADTNYRTVFAVHAGLRVRIQERDQGWVRVRLANGLEGWLPEAEGGRI